MTMMSPAPAASIEAAPRWRSGASFGGLPAASLAVRQRPEMRRPGSVAIRPVTPALEPEAVERVGQRADVEGAEPFGQVVRGAHDQATKPLAVPVPASDR